jgi:hypothetical protein
VKASITNFIRPVFQSSPSPAEKAGCFFDMNNTGFIKIFRSIMDKGWYKDSECVALWLHLLLKANHKGAEFMLGYSIVKLLPGQFVTGRKALSQETGIKESKIERILKLFEIEQQIEQQTNSRNRIITIVSWDCYQNSEQQVDSPRTASEQPVDTNKNNKNVISIKKEYYKNNIEKNKEKEKIEFYKAFANFLFSSNPSGKPILEILKIENQVDYDDFCKLFSRAGGDMKQIFDKLATMMNDTKYTKGKKYLFLTLNNWFNQDAKRK